MTVAELIKAAGETLGSEYRVAKAIGVSPQRLSAWKAGRATCSPEQQALIAACADMDARDTLISAVIAKHHGTPLGERLEKVLRPSLLGVVEAPRKSRNTALHPTRP